MRDTLIEVCEVIIDALRETAVQNTNEQYEELTNIMYAEWQFPFAFCSIDRSHLPIKYPIGGGEAKKSHYNFKRVYSIVLMALVDTQYRFIWARVGTPGNTHDSTNFQSTKLWESICKGNIIPEKMRMCEVIDIPPMILVDGANLVNETIWECDTIR